MLLSFSCEKGKALRSAQLKPSQASPPHSFPTLSFKDQLPTTSWMIHRGRPYQAGTIHRENVDSWHGEGSTTLVSRLVNPHCYLDVEERRKTLSITPLRMLMFHDTIHGGTNLGFILHTLDCFQNRILFSPMEGKMGGGKERSKQPTKNSGEIVNTDESSGEVEEVEEESNSEHESVVVSQDVVESDYAKEEDDKYRRHLITGEIHPEVKQRLIQEGKIVVDNEVDVFYPYLAERIISNTKEHADFIESHHYYGNKIDKFVESSKKAKQRILGEEDRDTRKELVKTELENIENQLNSFLRVTTLADTIREASSTYDAIRKGGLFTIVKELTGNDSVLQLKERKSLGIPEFKDWCKINAPNMSESSINNCIKLSSVSEEIKELKIAYLGQERLMSLIRSAFKYEGNKRVQITLEELFEEYSIVIPTEGDSNRQSEKDFILNVDSAVIHKKLIGTHGLIEIERDLVRDVLKRKMKINKAVTVRLLEAKDKEEDYRQILVDMVEDGTGHTEVPINKQIEELVGKLKGKLKDVKSKKEFKKEELNETEIHELIGKLSSLGS